MSTIKSSDEHLTLNADGSSKDIKFQANGVEKASISSSGAFTSTTIDATKLTGNLPAISGASLTSLPADATKLPLAGGTLTGNLIVGSVTDPTISLLSNANDNATSGRLKFREGDGVNGFDIRYDGSANLAIIETTDASNAIRLARTTGYVGIGASPTTDARVKIDGAAVAGHHALELNNHSYYAPYALKIHNVDTVNRAGHEVAFKRGSEYVGSISTSTTATSYNTSSDYRLKENVDYTWDATTRLKQLKPARFNFIADDTNTLVDGFIAHEVSSVVPEAISGAKDAVDSDGNIDAQGIDQSKLVPLLVKTIQELEARITALEA